MRPTGTRDAGRRARRAGGVGHRASACVLGGMAEPRQPGREPARHLHPLRRTGGAGRCRPCVPLRISARPRPPALLSAREDHGERANSRLDADLRLSSPSVQGRFSPRNADTSNRWSCAANFSSVGPGFESLRAHHPTFPACLRSSPFYLADGARSSFETPQGSPLECGGGLGGLCAHSALVMEHAVRDSPRGRTLDQDEQPHHVAHAR